MPQLFRKGTNTIARFTIFGGLFFLAFAVWMAVDIYDSNYVTGVRMAVPQTVPFSHKHHVSDDGIDCRYCHTSVESSPFAGIPSTETCMTCHSQIWSASPMLEPVRASYRTNQPLVWQRVHTLPDYVYFNHGIHVSKGVGCSTCHGRVDLMPLTWRTETLRMDWCLSCHREPERFVRPRDKVFDMQWEPPPDQLARGRQLVNQYNIASRRLTDCFTCHR